MQIPMEILFQTMMRTDSGPGVRQKGNSGVPEGPRFEQFFEEALREADDMPPYSREQSPAVPQDETAPLRPKRPDDEKETDDSIAGVMGNQNLVVFILEGDMESATTPEIRPVTATATAAVTEIPAATDDEKPVLAADAAEIRQPAEKTEMTAEPAATEETPRQGTADMADKARTDAIPDIVVSAEAVTTPEPAAVSAKDVKAAVNNVKTQETAAVAADSETGNVSGEVTARKPIVRTSEQFENEGERESGPELSKSGDLSPLENENDTVPATDEKELKEKPHIAQEPVVRRQTEAQPTANSIPAPLAEGIRPERFVADQQMRRAADMPVRTENLFEEMVSRIETMQTESRQTMTIQLKPEFLGKVELEIAMDQAGLHVRILAGDNDVRGMINSQINALIESLENKGVEVVEVEVAYTGVYDGAFKDSHKEQTRQERPRTSFRVDRLEDNAAYFAAFSSDALDYYLDAGVSSVEYRA